MGKVVKGSFRERRQQYQGRRGMKNCKCVFVVQGCCDSVCLWIIRRLCGNEKKVCLLITYIGLGIDIKQYIQRVFDNYKCSERLSIVINEEIKLKLLLIQFLIESGYRCKKDVYGFCVKTSLVRIKTLLVLYPKSESLQINQKTILLLD